jgi:hypothetical protein
MPQLSFAGMVRYLDFADADDDAADIGARLTYTRDRYVVGRIRGPAVIGGYGNGARDRPRLV